ncbi:rRNA maturation RNase YbeY [Candidatus Peregrinibacteria bacterium]|nr:rRNA maturation RNase YbeY [Candidatus Peregrinibacteria bacterium]
MSGKRQQSSRRLHPGRTVRMKLERLYPPLREMADTVLDEHGVEEAEISLTFVGRDLIRRLNSRYLGRSGMTDVIAFGLSEPGEPDGPLVGDIYICVPRAASQARRLGLSLESELIRLAAHGLLHVLGYDHENTNEREEMFALQEALVDRFLPRVPSLS